MKTRSRHHRRPPTGAEAPTREAELQINALGAQGDGLAAGLFVPLTLPGERVRARISGDRAEVVEVLEASADRIAPVCPHYGDCGGCGLQHWAPERVLAWKTDLIRNALARVGLHPDFLPAFAAPMASRRRLALHARRVGQVAAIGFKARRSWRLAPITVCPVADPTLEAAFPALGALAEPFLEHPKSAPILHVTLTLTGLDIDVTGVEQKSGGLSADAMMRAAQAAAAGDFARVTLSGEMVYQARAPMVRLGRAQVALPAGGFLQAAPQAEAAMIDFARRAAAGAGRIADLFCGAGTFTFPLAEIAPVKAADSAEPAVRALVAARASAPGLKAIEAEARDLTRRPVLATELKGVDVALFDPPRAGAEVQAAELGRSGVGRVIGVSCNPVTFARDARILADAGFRLETVLPIDQFLHSPHVELAALFTRGGG